MPADLLLFATVALVAITTPGPTVLLALNNGARWGVRAALPGLLGAVLSDAVLMAAAALGAGALLAGSAFAFGVLKWLGAAYLAWLGWCLLRGAAGPAGQQGVLDLTGAAPPAGAPCPPARRVLWRSFAVAVSNPKGYLFVTALLPQFVLPTQPAGPQFLVLALVFAAIDALVMLAYAALGAHGLRALPRCGLRWLDRVCGANLCALGASLALYSRPET